MTLKSHVLLAGTIAIAAGICADAGAQTNVTLYGTVDVALMYVSNQNGSSKTKLRSGNLAASKFGLKGSEDLGSDTQAIFVLESGFDAVEFNSTGIFSRQTTLGLTNKHYGTLNVGRQYSPYYLFVGPLGPTSILTGATGAHPGDIDGLDTLIRISNSISYASPLWSGAQVSVLAGFGEQPGSNASGSSVSAAFKYDYRDWNFALGYLQLKNGNAPGVWDPTASATFGMSAINNGYVSADSIRYLGAAARYSIGKLMLGANATNVAYRPGGGSLFTDKATFNTAGVIASYQLSAPWFVSAGYSHTRERAANGISDPAKYHQLSLEQTYSFSKRTAFYLLEAYQRADGQTLAKAGSGNPVNAVAVVGDSQNGTPSSGRSQTVLMMGLRHNF
ncbi:porin [Noviherbaspirillum sedimenti]|uniref:Porin n=1 Tax=Noviherbaspirillum sedimenti TaxID=2320865 RepID=A0A3A3FW99_9BURK|nr:porin [Noviherbaspirillum sedimenti]RJG00437.1 porin [Noviherbaspirillum sedimenti]